MGNHSTLCIWLLSILISIIQLQKSETYIIQMDLSAMPKAFSGHHSWYLATLSSVSDSSTSSKDFLSSKLVYAYTNAINGFSATLSPSELEAIKNSPGYVSSIKICQLKLTQLSVVWPKFDFGKDVIVGLVDTGVWPGSRSYSDDGMTEVPSRWKGECESGTQFNSSLCNKKLIGAHYFNKGILANNPNLTISMDSTRDTDGHGTHTSSTAAGSHVEGSCGHLQGSMKEGVFLSDILEAIDQPIAYGVDVLPLSLGIDAPPLHEDPVAIATFAALEKGPFYETLHNETPWVLTVAAGTVDREFIGTFALGNGVAVTGLSLYPGNSSSSESFISYVDCQDDKELQKNAHEIVVCIDNNDSFSEDIYNVRNSKVAGAVFITNSTDLEFYPQKFQVTHIGAKPAPKIGSYSSRGPSPSCPIILKPDLIAPGALILASCNFNIISGTSMSCPHASGVAALLKGAHPEWSPAAIQSAMMTTAYVLDNTQSPIQDIGEKNAVAAPLAMGAGHINPNKALDPGLIYDATPQDYVCLLCALNLTAKQIQTITRTSSYTCSNPSLDLNYPSFIGYFNRNSNDSDPKRIQEFKRTVTNFDMIPKKDRNSKMKKNEIEEWKLKDMWNSIRNLTVIESELRNTNFN
ncbi:unnamed protein product [Withania somnifera]